MFSSNQVLEISGSMNQLQFALQFALDYSGHAKNMEPSEIKRGCKLVYQISKDGKYCIGWDCGEVSKGWQEYPFDFEVDIVARIIAQYLRKMETPDNGYEWADGDVALNEFENVLEYFDIEPENVFPKDEDK